ncbi:MAG TPA: hypothetical protein VJ717_08550, partial [Gemmatimonadaceae bacterium]|nr:hypothetical protein [Gemmatimonadaceae bacterium]
VDRSALRRDHERVRTAAEEIGIGEQNLPRKEMVMKRTLALAAVVGVVVLGAAQASASSAPLVIPYEKDCVEATGHCEGTAGDGGTLEMQVTSFRAAGTGAQLTVTEWITVGDISFTAELTGHVSPAGFIVLNGTVTEGSFLGAEVHQRSNLASTAGTTTSWTGELRLMPPSA